MATTYQSSPYGYGMTQNPDGTSGGMYVPPVGSTQSVQPGVGVLPNLNVNLNVPLEGITGAVQQVAGAAQGLTGAAQSIGESVKPVGETFATIGDTIEFFQKVDWVGVGIALVGLIIMLVAVFSMLGGDGKK